MLWPAELQGLTRWSGRPDSNRRQPAWQAGALPTELLPRGSGGGGRTRTDGLQGMNLARYLTALPRIEKQEVVGQRGLEPPTPRPPAECAARLRYCPRKNGGGRGNRTPTVLTPVVRGEAASRTGPRRSPVIFRRDPSDASADGLGEAPARATPTRLPEEFPRYYRHRYFDRRCLVSGSTARREQHSHTSTSKPLMRENGRGERDRTADTTGMSRVLYQLSYTATDGWGGRIRTHACRDQNPMTYRLSTPQQMEIPTGFEPALPG
jgi:hypothetical protein